MTVLAPTDIAALIVNEYKANGQTPTVTKIILYTSIVLAESGGDTNIVNTKGNNPAGSRDRGLWAWNDHWHPEISDADAFDPVKATHWAWIWSQGFTKTSPMWTGSKGLTQTNITNTSNVLTYSGTVQNGAYVGTVIDDAKATANQIPGVGSVLGTLTSWTDGLTTLLAHLVSSTWWKRIGIGTLGIGIIIVGLIVIFAKPIEQTAKVAAIA